MKPRWNGLALVLVTLVSASLLVEGIALRSARADAAAAEASLRALAIDATAVERLRSGKETLALHPRPAADVVAEIQGVLAEAGIPSRHLESLVPAGDERVSGSDARYRRQTVRVTLSELPLTDLGRFLERLRATASLWTITGLEILRGPSAPPEGNVFQAQIDLCATYAAVVESGGGSR